MNEGQPGFGGDGRETAIDEISVIPIPMASTQRTRGVGVLHNEIFERVDDPLGGIGHAGQAPSLPFVTNLRNAERADVEFRNLVIEKIFQRTAHRQTVVSTEPNSGIKQDLHRKVGRMPVHQGRAWREVQDQVDAEKRAE